MGKHRKPRKFKWTIMWGWWPSRRSRTIERYRATHKPLWVDGEVTQEVIVTEESHGR